jgi:peptidylprolyl isomerase
MSQAKNNDKVAVHYTGKLDDGTVFDTSANKDPLEFTLGAGQVIPGFENGIIGMAEGETKTVKIAPAEAYGDVRQDLIISVKKDEIPADINVEVGQHLQINQPNGQAIPVKVTAATDTEVTLDANHPLAGQTLTFDIELVKIA